MNLTLDEKKAAEILGLAVQTLRNFRHIGRGPVYHKIGTRVIYRRDDLEAFLFGPSG